MSWEEDFTWLDMFPCSQVQQISSADSGFEDDDVSSQLSSSLDSSNFNLDTDFSSSANMNMWSRGGARWATHLVKDPNIHFLVIIRGRR